jgi:hypothetical protein
VIEVIVPWDEQRRAVDQALDLKNWCKEQGLVMDKDFTWHFHPTKNETVFNFVDEHSSFSTFFAIKWIGNEI